MNPLEEKIYALFRELNITDYRVTEHPAIYSTEDSDRLNLTMEGMNVKNLLIKQKKNDHYFLVVIDEHRHMDLKYFKELTNWGKVRFAHPEELVETLGLEPGSVTPLTLFHDVNKKITVVLDAMIANAPDEEWISFHPARNTATLTMRTGDFRRYLAAMDHEVIEEPAP